MLLSVQLNCFALPDIAASCCRSSAQHHLLRSITTLTPTSHTATYTQQQQEQQQRAKPFAASTKRGAQKKHGKTNMASRNNYFCGISTASTSAISLGAPSESSELPLLLQVSGLAKVKVQSIKKERSNSTYLRCGLCSTRALTQLGSGSGTDPAQSGAADWPAVPAEDDKPEEHEMMSCADERAGAVLLPRCLVAVAACWTN